MGRGPNGIFRYGRDLETAELLSLRDQELENCTNAATRGQASAVRTLAGYYKASNQTAALVPVLESYIDAGQDRNTLANSGAFLYRAYASGSQGVPRDDGKAFRYLGVAVNNGKDELKLTYGRELVQRQLYEDAVRLYRKVADNGAADLENRCEARLGLAHLYFGASPRHENWNLGYYYWREGLAVAASPDWGSCVKDNFVYGDRYDWEAARKRFVDSRLALMSNAQRQVIDEARRDSGKGYAFVAELDFQRPAGALPATASGPRVDTNPTRATAATGAGWPTWRPLAASAGVCRFGSNSYPQAWSAIFEDNAGAIWTVDSRNGKTQAQGSAVAVSPRELITNCHLIENTASITLRRVGWTLPAVLKAADGEGDRCILTVGQELPDYVRTARSQRELKVGEDVAAIGNPKGLETSLSRGIVAQKRARDGLQLIQTDAAISPGSSGGGLFDRAGNLVGITTFTISSGQSLNFAIAIEEFCR